MGVDIANQWEGEAPGSNVREQTGRGRLPVAKHGMGQLQPVVMAAGGNLTQEWELVYAPAMVQFAPVQAQARILATLEAASPAALMVTGSFIENNLEIGEGLKRRRGQSAQRVERGWGVLVRMVIKDEVVGRV
jgi:hypothetical protein